MLKKSILAFFSSLRRGACPRHAPCFKRLRVRNMAVDPSTARRLPKNGLFGNRLR
jgi:hypothetical protein